jgi:hypothetical protein
VSEVTLERSYEKGRKGKRWEECLSYECFANVCDVYEELREVKKR